ncbi:branched-chain amino acid transport system II carrier protein [Bacillus sp. 1P06AnD]|uniref:branched-chain amino acid transport system II carrier protein n=1 Tax=Bacillus sp. 1P06AnD TaxID=3132208 RepID=UPI0039A2AAC8
MRLQVKHIIIVGLALFALYFGAGNLMFPPTVGQAAGTNWPIALIGFSITGIVLPLLAVLAVYNTGGTMEKLMRPVGRWFYKPFNTLLMVCIGMCVTMPRMAATTHELGVAKIIPGTPTVVTIIIYFAIVFYFCLDKSNVIDKIGKWLTPLLVLALAIIIIKGISTPLGAPIDMKQQGTLSSSLLSAYQTGDVGTGILVAPVFLASILAYGYKGKLSKKVSFWGIGVAGVCLLFVYGGLLYIGATVSNILPSELSDTERLSSIVDMSLGSFGTYAIAVAIILACLTSTIGVMVIVAEFINELTLNKLGYKTWVAIICVICATIGSLGVAQIVKYTMPIFLAVYPIIIALVLLGTFHRFVPNDGAYKGTILFTAVVSILDTAGSLGVDVPGITSFIGNLPLSSSGFAWVVPAVIGFIVGAIVRKMAGSGDVEPSELPKEELA